MYTKEKQTKKQNSNNGSKMYYQSERKYAKKDSSTIQKWYGRVYKDTKEGMEICIITFYLLYRLID